jgi:hypothetical protein
MTWVWEHSRSKSTDRLVLLAIADCAADDGSNAYPSMKKLTLKTGLTDRGVQRSVARLVALGELKVALNAGPRGCNRYRVTIRTPDPESPRPTVTPPTDSHPEQGSPPTETTPDPDPRSPGTVLEPSEKISSSKRSTSVALPERPDVEQVCRHLADRIEANGSKRPTITGRWRESARLLIDRDGRTAERIHKAIDWCQDDEFWRGNILSMPKLREKYDQLAQHAQRVNRSNGHKPSTTDQRVAAALALAEKFAEQEST